MALFLIKISLILFILLLVLVFFFPTIVYAIGYFVDSLLGSIPSCLILNLLKSRKLRKFQQCWIYRKAKLFFELKSTYLRYETPLWTYLFCFMPVALIYFWLPSEWEEITKIFIAMITYLLFYFVGMYRKYRKNNENYEKVLENNRQFLKLSFVPIAFFITIIGFFVTVTDR